MLKKQILRGQVLHLLLNIYPGETEATSTDNTVPALEELQKSYLLGCQGTMVTKGKNSRRLKAHMTQDIGDKARQQK